MMLVGIVLFVVILRWVFRVRAIEKLLEEQVVLMREIRINTRKVSLPEMRETQAPGQVSEPVK